MQWLLRHNVMLLSLCYYMSMYLTNVCPVVTYISYVCLFGYCTRLIRCERCHFVGLTPSTELPVLCYIKMGQTCYPQAYYYIPHPQLTICAQLLCMQTPFSLLVSLDHSPTMLELALYPIPISNFSQAEVGMEIGTGGI